MADINSIRVGQLPTTAISLGDFFAHEVGSDLSKSTIEDLALFIANYVSTLEGVGFRSVSVTDGQTLPTTAKKEFALVGKGTYYNVGGGSTLVLNEGLNAIISNGEFWDTGVEIPVVAELSEIVQTIRQGFTTTTPSEDAVFNALALKANSDYVVNELSTKQNKLTAGTNVTIDITNPLNPVINAAATSTDISGKVDKVAGKSLILDTEITRLAGVTNQDISGKQNTLVSGTNIRTVNGQTLLGSTDLVISAGAADPSQITITTTVSITTDTLGNLGKTQKEKNVIIDNGVNAINITVNGGTNFIASYLKHGTGAITFVQAAGRTLTQVDATAILNGVVGSTATISSVGTKDYLRISNAV